MAVSLAYQATLDAANFNQQIQGMIGSIRNLGKEAAGIGAGAGSQISQGLSGALRKGNFASVGKEIGETITQGIGAQFGMAGQVAGQLAQALGPVGIVAGVAGAALIGVGAASVSMASQWQTGMTGISKTTSLTGTNLNNLSNELLKLSSSMPTTAKELQNIAQVAGSLGVAKTEIAGFTEAAAMMAVGFEMPAEAAATASAKILTAFGKPINTENMMSLGNVVNAMGDNFAATESQVLDFTNRASYLNTTMGMTIPQVAALGTTLISVGMEAETAATGIKSALNIGLSETSKTGGVANWAKLMGTSVDELKAKLSSDLSGTLVETANKIGAIEDPVKRFQVAVQQYGTEGAPAILKLAGQTDNLNKALGFSEKEWKNGTSLMKTYEAQSSALGAQFTILGNTVNRAGVELGSIMLPAITSVVGGLTNMVKIGIGLGENLYNAFSKAADGVALLESKIASTGTSLGQGASTWINEVTGGAIGYDELSDPNSEVGRRYMYQRDAAKSNAAITPMSTSDKFAESQAMAANLGSKTGNSYVDALGNALDTKLPTAFTNAYLGPANAAITAAAIEAGTKSGEDFATAQENYMKNWQAGGVGVGTDKNGNKYIIGGGNNGSGFKGDLEAIGPGTSGRIATLMDNYSYQLYKTTKEGADNVYKVYDKTGKEISGTFLNVADIKRQLQDTVIDLPKFFDKRADEISETLADATSDGIITGGQDGERTMLESLVQQLNEMEKVNPLEFVAANLDDVRKDIKDSLAGIKIDVAAAVKPVWEDWQSQAYRAEWSLEHGDTMKNLTSKERDTYLTARALANETINDKSSSSEEIRRATELDHALSGIEENLSNPTISSRGAMQAYIDVVEKYATETNNVDLLNTVTELVKVYASGLEKWKAEYWATPANEREAVYDDQTQGLNAYEKWGSKETDKLTSLETLTRLSRLSLDGLADPTKNTERNTAQVTRHIEFLKNPTQETSKNTMSTSLNTEKAALAAEGTKEAVATLGTPLDAINDNTTTANKILAEISAKFTNPTTVVNNNWTTPSSGDSSSWDYMVKDVGTAKKGAKLNRAGLRDSLASATYQEGGVVGTEGIGYLHAGEIVISPDNLPCAVSSQYTVLENPSLFNQSGLGSVTSSTSGITYDTQAYGNTIQAATKNTGEFSSCIESAWHEWQMSKADELFYQTQGIRSTRTATESYEKATVAANNCAGACNLLDNSATLAAGSLNINRLSYSNEDEKFSYVPPSGYSLKNVMMGRVPKEVYQEYKDVTAEIETLNKALDAQKENYLSCWDIASDYTRWLWQPEQQQELFYGSYIGTSSGHQAWVDSGRKGAVGYDANAELLGGFFENEAGRQFRDNDDPTALLAQSKFGSTLQMHVDKPTGELKLKVDQNTGVLSKLNTGVDKLTSSLNKSTEANDKVWAAIDKQIQADKEGNLVYGSGLGSVAKKSFRLGEFDTYIASAESGLSSCIESLSDFAIWQEGIYGPAGAFRETYIGLNEGWAGPGNGAKEGYTGPNFQDFMPDWGPFAAEASRRWDQQSSSDKQANQLLGKIDEGQNSAAKSSQTSDKQQLEAILKENNWSIKTVDGVQKVVDNTGSLVNLSQASMAGYGLNPSSFALVYGGGGGGGSNITGLANRGGGIYWGGTSITGGGANIGGGSTLTGGNGYVTWGGTAVSNSTPSGNNGTVHIGRSAAGGIFDTPSISTFAEDGPEAIVPLNDQANGMRILRQILPRFGINLNQRGGSAIGGLSSASQVPVTVTGNNVTKHVEIKIDARMFIEKVESSIDLEAAQAAQEERLMKKINYLVYQINGGGS